MITPNLLTLNLQVLVALGVYIVIYRVYLQRWFSAQTFDKAVLPFLLLHVFRYLGLMLLAPGQIDPALPREALAVIAWGDFMSGVCALSAAIALHHRWSVATILVVLFSIVGLADFIVVGITAASIGIFEAEIGIMWFLATFFAPVLLLSQIYIAYRLVRHLGKKSDIVGAGG